MRHVSEREKLTGGERSERERGGLTGGVVAGRWPDSARRARPGPVAAGRLQVCGGRGGMPIGNSFLATHARTRTRAHARTSTRARAHTHTHTCTHTPCGADRLPAGRERCDARTSRQPAGRNFCISRASPQPLRRVALPSSAPGAVARGVAGRARRSARHTRKPTEAPAGTSVSPRSPAPGRARRVPRSADDSSTRTSML